MRNPGPEATLELTRAPDPVPQRHEVLVRVHAAGVNRADLLQRRGLYPPPPGAPAWPGLEVSGVVESVGAQAGHWQPGDRVCCLLPGGGYAEQVSVDHRMVLPVPGPVSLTQAAALPEVACTVWSNLVDVAGLRAGQTLLVHGGSSGIGTMAIQVATALGARVAVTAGSPTKLQACRSLGADIVIDYRRTDFVQVLDEATAGHGADVILDVVGAKYLARNIEALAIGGRLVVIGLLGGRRAELDLAAVLAKQGTICATSLRARAADEKAGIVAAVAENVWPMMDRKLVKPVIDREFPLAQAQAAHDRMAAGEHIGKIVLLVHRTPDTTNVRQTGEQGA